MFRMKCKICGGEEVLSHKKPKDIYCEECGLGFSFWEEKYFVLIHVNILMKIKRRSLFSSQFRIGKTLSTPTEKGATKSISVEALGGSPFLSRSDVNLLSRVLSLEFEYNASTDRDKIALFSAFGIIESVNEELIEVLNAEDKNVCSKNDT